MNWMSNNVFEACDVSISSLRALTAHEWTKHSTKPCNAPLWFLLISLLNINGSHSWVQSDDWVLGVPGKIMFIDFRACWWCIKDTNLCDAALRCSVLTPANTGGVGGGGTVCLFRKCKHRKLENTRQTSPGHFHLYMMCVKGVSELRWCDATPDAHMLYIGPPSILQAFFYTYT